MTAIYKIAETDNEKQEAYRLIYNAYVANGLIKPNREGIYKLPHHDTKYAKIFIAKHDKEIVYTMTIIDDGPLGLPLGELYYEELEKLRNQKLKIAEAGSLAGKIESINTLHNLFARAFCYGLYNNYDCYLSTVHPKHQKYYERFWGFVQIGEIKTYKRVENHPAVLLKLDFKVCWDLLPERTIKLINQTC